MSAPKAIFIDTSIFDEQNFNFRSAQLMALLDSAKANTLTLLLPDPIEREINRHISEQVEVACKALEDARRKAPLLAKWKEWPTKANPMNRKWELRQLAQAEWEEFLSHFKVVRLGYEGIDLKQIMNWYDFGRAPFGTGKKRKEFPDALAIEAVALAANQQKGDVAVITRDNDLKNACAHYSSLLHFPSLASFTEVILMAKERVAAIKGSLADNPEPLIKSITEAFLECSFYPEDDPEGDVEKVSVDEVEILDLKVVSLGDQECKIAFDAQVSYSAKVTYDDPDSLVGDRETGYFALRKRSGAVDDLSEMAGVAKIALDSSGRIPGEVSCLWFDNSDVCVTAIPPEVYEDEW